MKQSPSVSPIHPDQTKLTNYITRNDDNVITHSDVVPTNDNVSSDLFVLQSLCQLKPPEPSPSVPSQWVAPILVAQVQTTLGSPKIKDVTVLLDSGASSSIVSYKIARKLRLHKGAACTWNTAAGILTTSEKTTLQFMLPELSEVQLIEWHVHVVHNTSLNYDIIIGCDMLEELGIIIDFKTKQVTWDEVSVPMCSWQTVQHDGYFVHDSPILSEATDRTTRILDAHYEPADFDTLIADCHNLTFSQKQQLHDLLTEFHTLFDGTLGHWKDQQVNIQLKEGAQPYHARAFPIPKSREQTLKNEISRLCQLGV